MHILFERKLSREKANGDVATWVIRVESPSASRGAFITTEARAGQNGKLVVRTKSVLKGKRMRSSQPQYPADLAVREANSRVIKKMDDGYESAS